MEGARTAGEPAGASQTHKAEEKMRKLGIVVAALLCLYAVPALAAAPGEITFGLNGGVAVPMGDFGDAYKMGFTGGVFADYAFSPMFALGLDASYNQFKGKDLPVEIRDDTGTLLFAITDAKVTPIQFGAHVKAMPPMANMPFEPYLQLGAGFYNVKAEVTTASDVLPALAGTTDETKSKFGYNIGIGADYKMTPQVGLGLFGTFHSITDAFTSDTATGTEKKAANYFAVGLKLTFMTTPTTTTKTTTP